jgi:predicted Zn-dependent protease
VRRRVVGSRLKRWSGTMTPTVRIRLTALLALAAVAVACATNPVTGRREISLMSEAQEVQIGQQADVEIRQAMPPYDDPELQQYVSRMGQEMARRSHRPDLPWTFTVVDVAAVNAFAVPGGYIYVTRGLLAHMTDEAELAGVLGHEIGHVTARHSAQQYTRAVGGQAALLGLGIFVPATRPFGDAIGTGLQLLFLRYGREDELQSDRLGVEYASASGWDPAGVPDFLTTLSRLTEETDRRGIPNWLSTHPLPEDRVRIVQETVAKVGDGTGTRNETEFLRRIDGIVFGDNPEQGIVRGDEFLHPDLRFSMQFPSAWRISNSPEQVVAEAPGGQGYMLLMLERQPQGRSIEEIALRGMQRRGLQPLQGTATEVNGLDAHVGLYRGRMEGLGDVGVRAAYVMHNRNVYMLVGLAPAQGFQQVDDQFASSIRSFRPLTRGEAADIRPNLLDLYTVRQGDTWQGIAERSGDIVSAATLAIMNGSAVNDQPEAGRRVKVVVAG